MKKRNIIVVSIIGLLLIVGGILIFMLVPRKSNKELYVEAVKKSLGLNAGIQDDEIKSISSKIEEYFSGKKYKLTIKGGSNQAEAGYTKEDIELYFGGKELYTKINQIISDEEKNIEAYFKDDVLYFTVKDILSKYYYINNTMNNSQSNIDIDLAKKIINYLADSFTESLIDDKITGENEDLSINGKTYGAKKYSYSFNGDSLYNMIVKFSEKVKKDSELMNLLKKTLESISDSKSNELLDGIEKSDDVEVVQNIPKDTNELIDSLLEEAKKVKEIGQMFTYTVYEYKDEVICTQIGANITTEQGNVPFKIAIYNVVENEKTYKKISVIAAGIEMYGLTIDEKDNKLFDINLTTMGQKIITGNINKISDGIQLHFENTSIMPNSFNIDAKIVKNGSGYIKINSDSFSADYDIEIKEVDEIPSIDTQNSSPIEEMTDEEKEKLRDAFNYKVEIEEDDYDDNDFVFKFEDDDEKI